MEILNLFNPLLHIDQYSVRIAKISISKWEGIKKFYDFRVYESLDDSSLF